MILESSSIAAPEAIGLAQASGVAVGKGEIVHRRGVGGIACQELAVCLDCAGEVGPVLRVAADEELAVPEGQPVQVRHRPAERLGGAARLGHGAVQMGEREVRAGEGAVQRDGLAQERNRPLAFAAIAQAESLGVLPERRQRRGDLLGERRQLSQVLQRLA